MTCKLVDYHLLPAGMQALAEPAPGRLDVYSSGPGCQQRQPVAPAPHGCLQGEEFSPLRTHATEDTCSQSTEDTTEDTRSQSTANSHHVFSDDEAAQ